MTSVVYLAVRYLAYHKFTTAILVLSITLILYIPTGLRVLVRQSQEQLTARAAATPLLIGAKGSPLELVLNSLYAAAGTPEPMRHGEAAKVRESGLAEPIPLYVRYRSQEDPIIGATLDYFDFRDLRVAEGAMMTRLGDCVLGAEVARRRGVGPGGAVLSSPESVFDLAGVYPLKMRVTGVLAPSGSPDDEAIFVDLKTAWIIEGLAHGHQDLAKSDAAAQVLKKEDNVIVGNASVVEYNEVTDDNIDSFHFHGDPVTFPITAIIAVPPDQKSATLLMGRYQAIDQPYQMVRPLDVMEELLGTILTVERFVVAALLLLGLATLATAALVFLLSLRLRQREIETMVKIGGSRTRIAAVLFSEVFAVAGISVVLAVLLTWITGAYGSGIIRDLILQ